MFLLLSASTLGCHKSIEEDISSLVSETRENFFMGQKDDFFVTFTDGRRESDYKMDGTCAALMPYGVVVLKTSQNLGQNPDFQLAAGQEVYSGQMEINPFDNTYVADIGKIIGNIDSLIFSLPSSDITIELYNKSKDWSVSCSKALDIFVKAHKDSLATFYNNGKLGGEVFIKIVQNSSARGIFYYVLFVSSTQEVLGSLIDVYTGQIVQQ